MPAVSTSIEVFCSYAHEDEVWLHKIETHLDLLKRQGLLSLWHDRLIIPGTNWARAIDARLETSSVILLVVSAHFFASDYCVGIEMKRALERQEEGSAVVIPILVSEASWQDAPFVHLQALPTDAKPITTWPDEETALSNVTAGIRRAIEELPLLAASAPRAALPTIWNIPYSRNPFFLGRETELDQIRSYLQRNQATALSQPQAISGLGGIGKTQLALEYAYRYHEDYQIVLWAHAESTEALVSSYIALATLLRLPEHEAREQEIIVQAMKRWLQMHRDWLFIIDNADELTLLPDFLPPSLGGHLLLTTRAATTGRLAHRLEIETLDSSHGALLLLRRAGFLAPDEMLNHVSQEQQGLAMQISLELGGLPLALDQAGAYLEETGTNLANYWHLYQQHRAILLQERRGLVADHPAPVATTWSLSFERVKKNNPAAAQLLKMAVFLSPDTIPEELFTTSASFFDPILAPVAANSLHFNQAMEALRAYSLIRRNPTSKTLSLHRLVQAVFHDALEKEEQRSWAEQVVHVVNNAFPNAEYSTWPQCERMLTQALHVAQLIDIYKLTDKEGARLLYETASYLNDRARHAEAEPLYLRAISINEQQLGSEHSEVARPLNGLANLYLDQGKYAEAEPLYLRAISINEQQLGSEHPQIAYPLQNLAILYTTQGKYAEAEPLFLRALCIREQQLGFEHPQVAHPLNGLANLYCEQGKYAEAEPLYLRALRINEQQLGSEHPLVAYPLQNLAVLYLDQGKYAEAEPLFLRVIHIREQQLGFEHFEVANPLDGLANIYTMQGKYTEAEPLFLRAIHLWEQQLGFEHPHVAHPLNGLANLYTMQGKYVQAEPLYQRTLYIREKNLEPQHSDIAAVLHDFAVFRDAQGASLEAVKLYQRALAIREHVYGLQHPKTTSTRERLQLILNSLNRTEQVAQFDGIQAEVSEVIDGTTTDQRKISTDQGIK